jgi:hypothetical protein
VRAGEGGVEDHCLVDDEVLLLEVAGNRDLVPPAVVYEVLLLSLHLQLAHVSCIHYY